MTPGDFHATRSALGLTQGALASALGVDCRTVRRWELGERSVPEMVRRILALALVDHSLLTRMLSTGVDNPSDGADTAL